MAAATLALDFGTQLGWALERPGRLEHGCLDLSTAGHEGEGVRFLRFRRWLTDTKARVEGQGDVLQRIYYEHVDFIVPGQARSAHLWGGWWATMCAWGEHHGIEYRPVRPITLKKQLTGNHKAKKPDMLSEVNRRLVMRRQAGEHPVRDHNTADAIALLLIQERRAA